MEFKNRAGAWERRHSGCLPLLARTRACKGCLRSQAPPSKVIVVNILLHEKGIENDELALVVLPH